MPITIRIDVRPMVRHLDDVAKKQLPYAISRTVTSVARSAIPDLRAGMKKCFDRPTPWTLNAFYAKPGKRGDPSAAIMAREFAPKGNPAYKYLVFQWLGGPRNAKGLEKALDALSGGQFAVPARGATMDGYGNMSRGQIVQILSRFNALKDPTQNIGQKTIAYLNKRKRTVAASGNRHEYFVAHEKGNGRPLGIYRLVGRGRVAPVLIFIPKAPTYRPRFDFEKIVHDSVKRHLPNAWRTEFAKAMQTAK